MVDHEEWDDHPQPMYDPVRAAMDAEEARLDLKEMTPLPSIRTDIVLPRDVADAICEMEDICWNEGLRADNDDLMIWIAHTYPDLKEQHKWLPWERYGNE